MKVENIAVCPIKRTRGLYGLTTENIQGLPLHVLQHDILVCTLSINECILTDSIENETL